MDSRVKVLSWILGYNGPPSNKGMISLATRELLLEHLLFSCFAISHCPSCIDIFRDYHSIGRRNSMCSVHMLVDSNDTSICCCYSDGSIFVYVNEFQFTLKIL